MKIICTTIVLLCVTTIALAYPNDEDKCEPGHQYQQECNTCTCSATGLYYCTRKACPNFPQTSVTKGKECEPGAKKKEDCNSCSCNNGIWVCTEMGCEQKRDAPIEFKTQFTEAEARSKDFRCEPTKNVKVDCNTCKCANDGKSLTWCTLIGCHYYDSFLVNRTKREDINAKYDRLERKGGLLNPYTDEELKQPNFKCEPDLSLKVGCKRCTCASDGKSVDFCIETSCYKRGESVTRSPEEYAKLNNKGSLLNPYTEEETKSPSFKCTPDASVKVDCKRCLCGDDGKTLTFCVDVSCYKVKSRSKRHIMNRIDLAFRGEKQTVIDDKPDKVTRPRPSPTTTQSTPTETHLSDPNCNTKPKNGTPTNCKKGTVANPYTEDEVEDDEDFTCKPNESFMVDCNICWCTEAGDEPGFCTRKACNPKVYQPLTTTTPRNPDFSFDYTKKN